MDVSEVILRTLAAFTTLYLISRFLGKKLISQMTFFDFVAGITLGSVTASVMFTANLSLPKGMLIQFIFFILVISLEYITLDFFKARKVLNSEPTLIIKNGKILEDGMKKTRLTMDDLLMHLRKNNVFYVDEVELAFFETDGTISVLKKAEQMPLTRQDMNVVKPSRGLAQVFIIDGQILENSLMSMGYDQKWVDNTLKNFNVYDIDDVALAQVDQLGTVYIDQRHDMIH